MLNLPHKPEKLGIKRVVALEGDWVTLDYKRRPNDSREGPTAAGQVWDAIGEQKDFGVGKRRWKVPLGHVWVEGDNAGMSKDSNTYGPVSFRKLSTEMRLGMLTLRGTDLEIIDCRKGYILSLAMGALRRKTLG